ncbi:MAG: rhodanese-like domain-containing protein [Sphaerochaetaceae bacterium]|jgi:rhodanese-related sulfurtransferase|nr:rhodanese-like domain-containing protein [Spirochaetaceae bacterium]MDY6344198.1 rhodanese-like domain-containing protein [Sphaerochaetaceae bacterium]
MMRDISQEEGKRMIEEKHVVLVDVRTPEEFKAGHIPGAINIRNESIKGEPEELPDKNARILLYCRSGLRAEDAMTKLDELGYTDLSNMGGILDWKGPITKN